MTRAIPCLLTATAWAALSAAVIAQGPPGGRGSGPPRSPRAAAPVDFTGYWVSIVSEDWRWRMITPPKGDYANIPLNAAGRKVADSWDPAKDQAAGEQCRAYAAPAIMREPGRLHITWQDDVTLKVEADAGQQTRLFQFGGKPSEGDPPSWQGYSVARWEAPPAAAAGASIPLGLGPRAGVQNRTLEVATTRIRPGYLRKNGIPFGANAVVTEYYDMFKDPDGTDWFVVTTIVQDAQYLSSPWVTTSHFRKEPDASKWNPQPCAVR